MKKPGDPEIVHVEQVDNAAVVAFSDDTEAVFPATLLHAAVGVAAAMHEKDREEEAGVAEDLPE